MEKFNQNHVGFRTLVKDKTVTLFSPLVESNRIPRQA
jgi:hypothetical protein